jgi:AraC family transcriptional regulator of adaptative response/methylated-DNA-[protein]-cysteine methyltransferase
LANSRETVMPTVTKLTRNACDRAYATDDDRWAAFIARDRDADGAFVVAVRTTGIFCLPSCPAKRPLRKNVVFHASPAAARRAGFRPCRRCRPEHADESQNHAALVAAACRSIESAETPPRVATLAAAAGVSASHFQRLFKEHVGVTPRAYAAAHRAGRLRRELRQPGANVTVALHRAGFGSAGRLYEQSPQLLGMTPGTYRAGGVGETIRYAIGRSSLGAVLVAATNRGVCFIALGDKREALAKELAAQFSQAKLRRGNRDFRRLLSQVVALVERPAAAHRLPLDIRGTAFQQRVWQALTEIPAGTTITYTELARRVGKPRAIRAAAAACASNDLAVAIPCHRVVRTSGSLAGYRWGIERKRALLDREAAQRASND